MNQFGYCCDSFYNSLCTSHIKFKDKNYGIISPVESSIDNNHIIERFKFIIFCPFCGKDVKDNLKLENKNAISNK